MKKPINKLFGLADNLTGLHLDQFAREIKYYINVIIKKDAGYNRDYYRSMEINCRDSYNILAKAIVNEFHPSTAVDVGCGYGGMSKAMINAGCNEVYSYDYSSDAVAICLETGLKHAYQLNLIHANQIPVKGDVCICLEVAEHIPERHAHNMCKLISEVAPILIFTASPPGQGGYLHVNLKKQDYWINIFKRYSMIYDHDSVNNMRKSIQDKINNEYYRNLMVFKRNAPA